MHISLRERLSHNENAAIYIMECNAIYGITLWFHRYFHCMSMQAIQGQQVLRATLLLLLALLMVGRRAY